MKAAKGEDGYGGNSDDGRQQRHRLVVLKCHLDGPDRITIHINLVTSASKRRREDNVESGVSGAGTPRGQKSASEREHLPINTPPIQGPSSSLPSLDFERHWFPIPEDPGSYLQDPTLGLSRAPIPSSIPSNPIAVRLIRESCISLSFV